MVITALIINLIMILENSHKNMVTGTLAGFLKTLHFAKIAILHHATLVI